MASVLLLLIPAIAAAAAVTTDDYAVVLYYQCIDGNCNDMQTAVALKESLINDLKINVPTYDVDKLYYYNSVTWKGVTMWGYGQCTRRIDNDTSYCASCLLLAGDCLIANCDDTASGCAWDSTSACYIKVGFSRDV
ncbi:hypothetical protein LINPERPRIM_LOCUS7766 [Linum perenne]